MSIVTRVGSSTSVLVLCSIASAQTRITLATAGLGGAQPNYSAVGSVISSDGRYVVFESGATNLVAGDTNLKSDVFVRDRVLGTTERASTYASGAESPIGAGHNIYGTEFDVSGDGRFVVFSSRDGAFASGAVHGVANLFVKDRVTGQVVLASCDSAGVGADDDCGSPALSSDGRFLAFQSEANNLAPGDDGLHIDVYVRDLVAGTTERVSVDSSGALADQMAVEPQISADGRFVVFESAATNLVPGDTNFGNNLAYDGFDVFVHDRASGQTERVSVQSGGGQALSGSYDASISGDGSYVCFVSRAPNMVSGDLNDGADVFVHDRLLGTTELVSLGVGATQANERCNVGRISGDGTCVVFTTVASNLHPSDVNGERDVYVRDLVRRTTTLMSRNLGGVSVAAGCYNPEISGDGRTVVFQTLSQGLTAGEGPGVDVFVAERGALPPLVYCTAKVNSLGCLPAIGASGVASASAAIGMHVYAVDLREGQPIKLLYGISGPHAAPFYGGTLCVRAPLRRLLPSSTSGSNPAGCAGTVTSDFNAVIAAGNDPALVAGQQVWAQFFGRDDGSQPGYAFTLTDAIELAIEP